jgi:thioredoxin 1
MNFWRQAILRYLCLCAALALLGPALPALAQGAAPSPGKPALYEFGAGYCYSCKEMAKIMAELQPVYSDRVEFRLVYADKEKELFKQYSIMLIPTQVFLDASGKEVERHIGPLTRDEIIQKLKDLKFIGK